MGVFHVSLRTLSGQVMTTIPDRRSCFELNDARRQRAEAEPQCLESSLLSAPLLAGKECFLTHQPPLRTDASWRLGHLSSQRDVKSTGQFVWKLIHNVRVYI